MTGTDLCVNKPHCAAAVQCLSIMVTKKKSVLVIFEPPCNNVKGRQSAQIETYSVALLPQIPHALPCD